MPLGPPEPRSDLDAVLEEAAEEGRKVADPGEVDVEDGKLGAAAEHADAFGITLTELDGTEHAFGDCDEAFPIQSISKMFALVLAMQKVDQTSEVADELWSRINREPSGDPFNSLVQLEHERGIPRNPMINSGALVVDDVLLTFCDDPKQQITDLMCQLAGEDIEVDPVVAGIELEGSHRNLAVANLMASFDNLRHPVADVLDLYVHQCALSMTTRQLARATRFLANDGVDPASGERILSDILARRVTSLMLTCGTYDAAGAFAFEVGLPCKSGVAGAITAVVPDEMAVAVWSPPLDETGNSRGGRVALHHLAEQLHLSIF